MHISLEHISWFGLYSNLDNRLFTFCRDYLAPTLSREKHHHIINDSGAGEGADRGEIINLSSIRDYIDFKKTSGTLPDY